MADKLLANLITSGADESFADSVTATLSSDKALSVFNTPKYFIFPGFCDVHVHFREPGFSYKETIKSGSAACARGGYTDVCSMPNLNPVPDNTENIQKQIDL